MKLIDDHELRRLLIDSERLRRLNAAGVDNWKGYYSAMVEAPDTKISLWEWIDDHLDNLLANYRDYQPKEFDNYNFD